MCPNPADEFGGFAAQAVDAFLAHILGQTSEAVRAAGERDYLDANDVEAVYRLVARTLADHRWRPPRLAEIVEACHRLNIRVQL